MPDLGGPLIRFILYGPPASKKTGARIIVRNRRHPTLLPSKVHDFWHQDSMRQLRAVRCARPIVPNDHMVAVEGVIYMGERQRLDAISPQESLWDLLEDDGILTNDFQINHFGDSRREWTEPWNPRIEVAIWDLGPKIGFVMPKVRVRGLAAAKGRAGPMRFAVAFTTPRSSGIAQSFIEHGSLPKTATRRAIVLEASRLWGIRHREPLPDGAVIVVENPQ